MKKLLSIALLLAGSITTMQAKGPVRTEVKKILPATKEALDKLPEFTEQQKVLAQWQDLEALVADPAVKETLIKLKAEKLVTTMKKLQTSFEKDSIKSKNLSKAIDALTKAKSGKSK